jgi:hypothetical protein
MRGKRAKSAAPRSAKIRQPEDAELAATLGRSKRQWDELLARLDAVHPGLVREWKHYGEKYGWQLKLMKQKRAVLYLTPHPGRFTASLALRDPAIALLRKAGIPADVVRRIEQAAEAPEGRPARVDVIGDEQAGLVAQLVAIKLGAQAGNRRSGRTRS